MSKISTCRPLPNERYPNPIFTEDDEGVWRTENLIWFKGLHPGSLVQTPDGEEWTIVANDLCGYCVIAGDHPQYQGAHDDQLPEPTHRLRDCEIYGENYPLLGEIIRVLRDAPKESSQ